MPVRHSRQGAAAPLGGRAAASRAGVPQRARVAPEGWAAGLRDGLGLDGGDAEADDLPGLSAGSKTVSDAPDAACVRFSADGRSWAAATALGTMLFSLDSSGEFGKVHLGADITPLAYDAAHHNVRQPHHAVHESLGTWTAHRRASGCHHSLVRAPRCVRATLAPSLRPLPPPTFCFGQLFWVFLIYHFYSKSKYGNRH